MLVNQGAESGEDPTRTARTLRRALLRLSRRLQVERPMRAVSLNQSSLLGHLIRRGPLTVGELCTLERAQAQSLTRPLAALEAEGLIERQPDAGDGRRVVISVTELGRRTVIEDMRQRDSWLALAMSQLTDTERQLLVLAAGLMDQISQNSEAIALRARTHPADPRATDPRATDPRATDPRETIAHESLVHEAIAHEATTRDTARETTAGNAAARETDARETA